MQKKEQTSNVENTRISELDKKTHLQIDVDDANNTFVISNENCSVNGSVNASVNASENNEGMCVSVLSEDTLTDDDSL